MSRPATKLAYRLARWCRQRGGESLHLLLALLILLASSGCGATVRGAAESELAPYQAEEELLDEEWSAGASRNVHRPRNRTTDVATLPHSFFVSQAGSFRYAPDHSPAGHLLPNGLRAPLRC